MKALIIGATGATGKDLVKTLHEDTGYTEIVIFVRRPAGIVHPKLREVITDFDNLDQIAGRIEGDVLFSCFGTTVKAAGSQAKQWHIDYEIPLKFAEIARKSAVRGIVLLSSYGASATSKVFYSRMKGELEDSISQLAFPQSIIFRPGLLLRKDSDRLGERVMASLLNFFYSLGLFKKFRPMPTTTLAEKMAKAPKVVKTGKEIIELSEIFRY